MEVHLKQLSQNTLPLRYKILNEETQLTLDTLETQKVSFAFKPWQIREKCLTVMKTALESHNPLLCNISLQGIEYLVRHPDLDGVAGEEKLDAMDSRIFVLQVLDSLNCLPSLSADQQVGGLKILLSLCCDFVSSFDGELIIKIVQMCLACWHKDKNNVHSAMIQLCAAYTMHTQKLCSASCIENNTSTGVRCAAESLASQAVDKLANADLSSKKNNDKLADVIGLAKFFVQQIKLASSDNQKGVFLECLLAVLKTLESFHVRTSEMFGLYVRNELCPTLASLISLNTMSTKVRVMKSRKKQRLKKTKDVQVTRSAMLHRKVALLSIELVRLVGSVASLRPHVALVFTHLLSSSTCVKHGIPFAILNKLWATPDMLFKLAGPFLVRDFDMKQNCTGILQLILDAMLLLATEKFEVDNTSSLDNMQAAINSVNLLLETLDRARQGEGFETEQISLYHQPFPLPRDHNDVRKTPDLNSDAKNDKIQSQNFESNDDSKRDKSDDESEDDSSDVWMSSEDVFTALSSPYYQSAAEDEDELTGVKRDSSKLFDLMQFIARSKQMKELRDSSDDVSSQSTHTASVELQEPDDEITKYVDDALTSDNTESSRNLLNAAESTRDSVLARRHFASIQKILDQLLLCDDVASVDQTLQKAASRYCSDIYEKWELERISVQAESLYTLSYSMLLLCLRLKLSGHYESSGAQLPCVKSQWVDYQQSCGVYLSKCWLAETFRLILVTDLFENIDLVSSQPSKLVVMLGELDGLGCSRVENGTSVGSQKSSVCSDVEAGFEFAQQILVSVWSDLLQILQTPLLKVLNTRENNLSTSLFLILSPSSLRVRTEKERECIVASLDGLRASINLSCALDLQSYSSTVIAHLVEACIPNRHASDSLHSEDDMRLHMCQVLFMDTVLDVALAVGRKSTKCWDAVFKVASYVACLDHACFHNNSPSLEAKEKFFDSSLMQETTILDVIKEEEKDVTWTDVSSRASTSMGFLNRDLSVKAVYCLSRSVDKFFDQAASSLDLRTLTDFFWSLCLSSNRQLFASNSNQEPYVMGTPLLYRLGECMLTCVRSPTRPLLHITNLWRYAAPHLTRVLGHSNTHLAKQAGTYVYNMVTTVLTYPTESKLYHPVALWSEQEPNYFHFVEDLLRPYERALQSEVCGIEVQELVIGAISQLVETSSKRICSGWRPLFSALKHISCNQQSMDRSPIFEVLNAFFVASSSSVVFSSAAHDCINCLLKLLGNFQDKMVDSATHTTPIIGYLEEVANILLQLHQSENQDMLTKAPAIETAYDSEVWRSLASPVWRQTDGGDLENVAKALDEVTQKCFSNNKSPAAAVLDPSSSSRTLQTWFYLLDGLALRTLTSSLSHQPAVLDLLCKLLYKTPCDGGFSLSSYILLHSCLPTLRTFLQRLVSTDADDVALVSYKHMFGTLMELTAAIVLKNLQQANTETAEDDANSKSINDQLWHAYLNLCVACIETRKEQLAKLACSCIRHVITTIGRWMTSSMIDDICACISYVIKKCLAALELLTSLVEQNERVLDEIIVDEKKSDSSFRDVSCLTRVFQLANYPQPQKEAHHVEIRLTYDAPSASMRVCLFELACDISTLNLILKCVEYMLLGNSLSPWQPCHSIHQNGVENHGNAGLTSSLHSTSSNVKTSEEIPQHQPLLDYVSSEQLHDLCERMIECFLAARKFDNLTSLQRFIQKLVKFYNAANLYQFAGLSICVYVRLLFAICCRSHSGPSLEPRPHIRPNPITRYITTSDLLPPLASFHSIDDESTRSDALKSDTDASSWAFGALYRSILFLCQPWDVDETTILPVSNNDDLNTNDDDAMSMHESVSSDDTRSQRSLDINLDYMAYVKKTDTLPSVKSHHDEVIASSKHRHPTRWLYRSAADKVVSRFMSAYKTSRSRKSSHGQEDSMESDHPMTSPLHRRRRTLSETSCHSGMIALDEQLLKRQAWSSTIESILRLLTSAPDPALSVLLPVIYQPLASLSNHRPLSNPLIVGEPGNDVGDAFHQWLLRIGQLCNYVPSKYL